MPGPCILWFEGINTRYDQSVVGGKGLNLGRLVQDGVLVPPGFVFTTHAWRAFIDANPNLASYIKEQLALIDFANGKSLQQKSDTIWDSVVHSQLLDHLKVALINAYEGLERQFKEDVDVAVRSSAVGEDLDDASFAGQHATYLNIHKNDLVISVKRCFASLFTARAISYRHEKQFPLFPEEGIAVVVQKMVRSDKGASGVAFTQGPFSLAGYKVHIDATYGLGEMLVGGGVVPDTFYVAKPLHDGAEPIVITKRLGTKLRYIQYSHRTDAPTQELPTPHEMRRQFCISDGQARAIAKMCCEIEKRYGHTIDVEWATDGDGVRVGDGRVFIVQVRATTIKRNPLIIERHELDNDAQSMDSASVILRGIAASPGIGTGAVNIIEDPYDFHKFKEGDILVTEMTTPDWMPVIRKAGAIVTNEGGMTCHAAIVAREFGTPCIVGTGNATRALAGLNSITVCCDEQGGRVFAGQIKTHKVQIDLRPSYEIKKSLRTKVMFIAGSPSTISKQSFYPNDGIGLARLEFIIANQIKVHPLLALHQKPQDVLNTKELQEFTELTHLHTNPKEFFIWELASGIMQLAAAVWPQPIIVRMSDFKSNEYANLLGGAHFEKHEENPMLGFRGASRYYDERYKPAFQQLECEALRRAREAGFTNIKAMIPFVRTPQEAAKVIALMAEAGLVRGENSFEVYCMVELPANIEDMKELAEFFDGFSIGSNDLTQLMLGLDRDSGALSHIGNEMTPSVLSLIVRAIDRAKQLGKPIGICGQAPTNHPEIVPILVDAGITSISVSPDAIPQTIDAIVRAENSQIIYPPFDPFWWVGSY